MIITKDGINYDDGNYQRDNQKCYIDSDDKCYRHVEAKIEETNITDDDINSDDGNDQKENAEIETVSDVSLDGEDKNVESVDIKDEERIRSDI